MPDFWSLTTIGLKACAIRDAATRGLTVYRVLPLTTGLWLTYEASDGYAYRLYDTGVSRALRSA